MIKDRFSLFINVFLLYLSSVCGTSLNSKLIQPLSLLADSKEVFVCSTFGFQSAYGRVIFENIFESSYKDSIISKHVESKELIILNCDDTKNFEDIGGSDVIVGYIHPSFIFGNTEGLLASIQAAFESAFRNRSKSKLYLFVSASTNPDIDIQKKSLLLLIEDAWKTSSLANKRSLENDIEIVVQVLPPQSSDSFKESKDSFWSWIGKSIEETSAISIKQFKSFLKPQSQSSPSSPAVDAPISPYSGHETVLKLQKKISSALASYERNPSFSPFSAEEVVAAVRTVIEDSLVPSSSPSSTAIDDPDSSSSKAVGLRNILEASPGFGFWLSSQLQPLYRKLLQTEAEIIKETFLAKLKKTPPNSALRQNLGRLARQARADFEVVANKARSAFLALLQEPLPSIPLTSPTDLSSAFSSSLETASLSRWLSVTVEDRVDGLFLLGAYNPFIRTARIPPTHLNLNYLIDPRELVFAREFNKLYDEHRDGAAETRAEQMRVPELSRVVFDPNLHPDPKEKKDMWRTVYDFYFKQ